MKEKNTDLFYNFSRFNKKRPVQSALRTAKRLSMEQDPAEIVANQNTSAQFTPSYFPSNSEIVNLQSETAKIAADVEPTFEKSNVEPLKQKIEK